MGISGTEKAKVVARLRRVEGQVRGLIRLLENESDCVDILLQISAVQGALGKVGQVLLGSHLETCVTEVFRNGKQVERKAKIDELMGVFARYGRLGSRG